MTEADERRGPCAWIDHEIARLKALPVAELRARVESVERRMVHDQLGRPLRLASDIVWDSEPPVNVRVITDLIVFHDDEIFQITSESIIVAPDGSLIDEPDGFADQDEAQALVSARLDELYMTPWQQLRERFSMSQEPWRRRPRGPWKPAEEEVVTAPSGRAYDLLTRASSWQEQLSLTAVASEHGSRRGGLVGDINLVWQTAVGT